MAEEKQDGQDHDGDGEAQRDQHLLHRDADELGIVGDDGDLQIVEPPVEPIDRRIDRVRYLDGVAAGLAHHAQPDDLLAVQPHEIGGIGGREIDLGHITDAGIGVDRDILDQRGGCGIRLGPHDQLLRFGTKAANGHIERRALQRFGHIGDRQAIAVEADRIDRHTHLPDPRAELIDAGHAVRGQQFGHDIIVDDAGQLRLVMHPAGYGQTHDRLRIVIGLDHPQLLDAVRQVALHAAHRFAHIAGRGIQIGAGIEFHADTAVVFLAGRPDFAHPGHAGGGIF